jgi:hypothetical protein
MHNIPFCEEKCINMHEKDFGSRKNTFFLDFGIQCFIFFALSGWSQLC